MRAHLSLSPGLLPKGSHGLSARAVSGKLRLGSFNRPGPWQADEASRACQEAGADPTEPFQLGLAKRREAERPADSEPQSICVCRRCSLFNRCCTIACSNQRRVKTKPLDFCGSQTSKLHNFCSTFHWLETNKQTLKNKKTKKKRKRCETNPVRRRCVTPQYTLPWAKSHAAFEAQQK